MVEITDSDIIIEICNVIMKEDYNTVKKALAKISLEELEKAIFNLPLVKAVEYKRIDVIKLLLEKEININKISYHKDSALSVAVKKTEEVSLHDVMYQKFYKNNYKQDDIKEIIKILLDNGANINFLPNKDVDLKLIKFIFDYKKDDIYYLANLLIFDKSLVDEYSKLIKKE